jgi:hexosaminidase
MKKALKIIGWILGILILLAVLAWFGFLKPEPPPISPEDRAQVTLLPLPAELKLGKGWLFLDENLGHEFKALSSPRMKRAVERFYSKLSTHTGLDYGQGTEKTLILECNGTEQTYPSPVDDESYSIKVTPQKIFVDAASETGIIYALESLLQLVRETDEGWVIPTASIQDHPRYPWRGLMIDACRHWIPKEVILRNLEAMGTLKMNVFHWHLTEYQGFRVESKLFPGLHEQGSGGDYYTQAEIREVIAFAADRGIRVVPEFDLPGHSTSWFVAYPELASAPGPYVLDTVFGILDPVMDPSREEVYEFLDLFFGEMSELFPDPYIHIGGDEVNATHWEKNKTIQEFAEEKGLEDAHALQAYFNHRLSKLLAGHGKYMMGWDEISHPDLPREGIVVQTWRNHASLWESARMGHRAVLSAGYYLDYKKPAGYHYNVDPEVITGAVNIEIDSLNWKSWSCTLQVSDNSLEGALYLFGEGEELRGIMDLMGTAMGFENAQLSDNLLSYSIETTFGTLSIEALLEGDSLLGNGKLALFNMQVEGIRKGGSDMELGEALPEFQTLEPLSPEEKEYLIGGEACMWSEMVDGRTMESRIWPRAAAVGEKLWSPAVLTTEREDMYRRLMHLDDRLEQLGLQHRSYNQAILRDLAPAEYLKALRILNSLLQEDEFFARMGIYEPQLYTSTPLNRMVDAAAAESYVAYRFGQDVERWISSQDPQAKDRMLNSLEIWADLHSTLSPVFEISPWLEEVREHSLHLSELAKLGLEALTNPEALKGGPEAYESLFTSARASYGGTILAVVEPVQKLLFSALGK